MNKKLIKLAKETFKKFPLDEIMIREIWQRGWRAYIFPNHIYGCYIGGRVLSEEKCIIVEDREYPSNTVSFFHELLHVQHNVEEGLTDPYFKQVGLIAIKSYPSCQFSDFDHDCIQEEAKKIAKSRIELLTSLHQLHITDRDRMKDPKLKLSHNDLLINVREYGQLKTTAVYFGVLKQPEFRYDYKIGGLI